MARYILLSTLTAEGRQTLHQRPARLSEVNEELERMGVKVVAQYAVLGPYDFITIVEAPDNETIAHASLDLGSRGTVSIMTLPGDPAGSLPGHAPGAATARPQLERIPKRLSGRRLRPNGRWRSKRKAEYFEPCGHYTSARSLKDSASGSRSSKANPSWVGRSQHATLHATTGR